MYLALQQEAQVSVATAYGTTSRLIRERWCQRLSTLGRTIEVRQGDKILRGIAEDVNDSGELFLRCHSGERVSITWGDIGYPTE
jgi:BirA family biotin operon repressor/biotin-[acetyl-CoA-carboxylase] ligase